MLTAARGICVTLPVAVVVAAVTAAVVLHVAVQQVQQMTSSNERFVFCSP